MYQFVQVGYVDTGLLHRVAVTESHGVVLECLVVDGYAVGSADGILTAVTFAY